MRVNERGDYRARAEALVMGWSKDLAGTGPVLHTGERKLLIDRIEAALREVATAEMLTGERNALRALLHESRDETANVRKLYGVLCDATDHDADWRADRACGLCGAKAHELQDDFSKPMPIEISDAQGSGT